VLYLSWIQWKKDAIASYAIASLHASYWLYAYASVWAEADPVSKQSSVTFHQPQLSYRRS